MTGRDGFDSLLERGHGHIEHLQAAAPLVLAERSFSLSGKLLQDLRVGGFQPSPSGDLRILQPPVGSTASNINDRGLLAGTAVGDRWRLPG